ncbi:MAG: oligosaccharide flippase family protein [Pseudomonadales bacterium]|nr:oligosaccharide flippase family protein [Pseudomonadales bacterium]
MLEKLSDFTQNKYIRNIVTLVSGTTVAQGIPLLLMVFLTRIYSPDEFGAWTLCLSIATLISLISTGRYELAIILPESDKEALGIFWLAIYGCLIVTLACYLVLAIAPTTISLVTSDVRVRDQALLIPAMVLALGWYQAINFRLIRDSEYRQLSLNRILNSAGGSLFQILLGVLNLIKQSGLFLGQILGYASALLAYSTRVPNILAGSTDLKTMFSQGKRYIRFPLIDVPAAFLNTASNHIPFFFIGAQFGAGQLGIYALTMRALGAPMVLVANAFLDVFRREASIEFNETGSCKKIWIKTFRILAAIAVLPTLVLYFLGAFLFGLFFGDTWTESGEIASALAVMFYIRFVSSPLSYTAYIYDKQIIDFVWQASLFTVTIGSIIVSLKANSFDLLISSIATSYSVLYLIYLVVTYYLVSSSADRTE